MKKQYGLSLVELMISIALGLVLISGVVQVFLSSKTVFVTQQGMSRIQETGRMAMEFIGRDLRISSYYGCVNTINPTKQSAFNLQDTVSASLATTTLHRDFTQGLRGYTDTTLPAGVSLGTTFTLATPSDILVIRGANDQGMPLSAANSSTQIFGYTKETSLTNNCVEGFCSGTIGVLTNCERGRFFTASGVPNLAANKVTLTLPAAEAWNMSTVAVPNNNYSSGNIFPVHTIVYFVATKTGSTIPSLWQKVDNDAAIELLQGVERMSLTYGCQSDPTCGFSDYRFAATVPAASWVKVSSVRVELLVRGLDQKYTESIQPYTFAGQLVTPSATDKVFRQVFDATFAIRSRFN